MRQKLTEIPHSPTHLAKREKLILSGLYLSRFDSVALARLGFDGFTEAFNVIGYALGARPASIKNYRDEFDPLFPNRRAGWHKRALREYCREVYEKYKGIGLKEFTNLVKSFLDEDQAELWEDVSDEEDPLDAGYSFAQRLVTGQAAERYFESVYPQIHEFHGWTLENTTQMGCGYDFRLRTEARKEDYLAIEVKGIMEIAGSVSMTAKEFRVANLLRERFILFVVKNFREVPSHIMFRDPLSCGLDFRRVERTVVQVTWSTSV